MIAEQSHHDQQILQLEAVDKDEEPGGLRFSLDTVYERLEINGKVKWHTFQYVKF